MNLAGRIEEMINKMSKRQFILLYMMLAASPVIKAFPFMMSETAAQAGWLSPLVSAVLLFGVMLMMNLIFKKHKGENLIQLSCKILSKPAGIIIAAAYFIWMIIMLGFYIRYFGENVVSNIMSEASLKFIMLSMLILVGVVLSKSIIYYARLNEVIFSCFILAFLITGFLALFTRVKIENLLPVSSIDIIPVAKGGIKGLSVFGYYAFLFFIFDEVRSEESNIKLEIKSASAVGLLSMFVMLVTIGAVGYNTILHFTDPYFMVVKNVDILGFLERLDAILFIMWILADFTTITIFTYMAASIVKAAIPKINKKQYIVYGVLAASYAAAAYGFNSKFLLELFAKEFSVMLNVIFALALPVLLLIVGKLRRMV